MSFKKGQSGNPAGRPKGSTRKAGATIHNNMAWFLEENFDDLKTAFKELTAKDRVRYYLAMMINSVGKSDDIPFHKMTDEDIEKMRQHIKEFDEECKINHNS